MRADDPFRRSIAPGDLILLQAHYPTDGFRPGQTDEHLGIFLGDAPVLTGIAAFHGFILLTSDGPIELMWQFIIWAGLQARLSEAIG